MKNFLTVLMIGLMVVATSFDADAAMRFGGGRSFGRTAPSLFQKAPAAKPFSAQKSQAKQSVKQNKATTAGAAAKPASPWRGMLMGAAAALGITALMSALGLSEEFAQFMMMVLLFMAIYAVVRYIMGRWALSRMGAMRGANGRPEVDSQTSLFESMGEARNEPRPGSVFDTFSAPEAQYSIPAGFDVKGFESVCRENFVALQKAWDTGNVNDISDFVTDDLFIAVTHQLRERGRVKQTSDVIDLSVKLLGIAQEGNEHVAVVSFNGAMKINDQFEEVREHWILIRPTDESSGWLLAGIEQTV